MTRKTSNDVYFEIMNNGLLSKMREEVYECLFNYGPMTGAEVSVLVKKKGGVSETVRNRLTELREMDAVDELGTTLCPITGRKVILWVTSGRKPRPLARKKTKRSKVEEIRRIILPMYTAAPPSYRAVLDKVDVLLGKM